MRKLLKIFFIIIIATLAASGLTSIAFGHTNNTAQLNGSTSAGPEITPALQADAPAAIFYGSAIGTITPGDLFYINAADIAVDMAFTLYLSNTDQLIPYLAYLNMEIAVYHEITPGQWERVTLPGLLLTMRNGLVIFSLPGLANYKVAIDGGCFNSHPGKADAENAIPSFYLEAETT
jgi:hypothetical protein